WPDADAGYEVRLRSGQREEWSSTGAPGERGTPQAVANLTNTTHTLDIISLKCQGAARSLAVAPGLSAVMRYVVLDLPQNIADTVVRHLNSG
ncbi:MAG: hypothetical protein WDA16_04610, partial [Candidatus Thermoplasmatota archaeon]